MREMTDATLKPDLSLIVPFFNEEENIENLILQLNSYAEKQSFSIEAILVDDGSTDSSVELLRNVEFNAFTLKLIRLSKNFGSHAAIRAGIAQSAGRYTMFFSADLQEPFEMIGEMYFKALEGYNVVVARKAETKVSLFEKAFSNAYTGLVRRFALRDYPKGGANNFLFSEKVRVYINENIESNSSVHMQIVSMGFSRAILDFSLNARSKGTSKWTLSKKVRLFIDSFVAFSFVPIKAISTLGVLLFIVGFLFALGIIVVKIFNVFEFNAGYPTLISVLLLGFGVTNFSIGIACEYLWRTFDAARNRPVYIVDTIEMLAATVRKNRNAE